MAGAYKMVGGTWKDSSYFCVVINNCSQFVLVLFLLSLETYLLDVTRRVLTDGTVTTLYVPSVTKQCNKSKIMGECHSPKKRGMQKRDNAILLLKCHTSPDVSGLCVVSTVIGISTRWEQWTNQNVQR